MCDYRVKLHLLALQHAWCHMHRSKWRDCTPLRQLLLQQQ